MYFNEFLLFVLCHVGKPGQKNSERAYQMELNLLIKRPLYGMESTGTLILKNILYVHLNDNVFIHIFTLFCFFVLFCMSDYFKRDVCIYLSNIHLKNYFEPSK